jgi:hypothetical protein
MTRRWFVMLCCVTIASAGLLAQSSAKTDPITGSWTGEIKPENDAEGRPITLDLKFDGKSAVTGTLTGLPSPGDVKKGTFDPATGALKLELGKTGETDVLLTFDGKVADGKAICKVTGEISATLTLTKKR